MAQVIVGKIDADFQRTGLAQAREVCRRWRWQRTEPVVQEWWDILQNPWEFIREILLEDSQEGRRLRQSSPFCGILTPQERWQIYKSFNHDEKNGY